MTNATNNTTTTDYNTLYANAENAIETRFNREFKDAEKFGSRSIVIAETASKIEWYYNKNLRLWTIMTYGPDHVTCGSIGEANGIDQIGEAQYSNTKDTLRDDVLVAVVTEIVRVTQMLLGTESEGVDVTTEWLCDKNNNEWLEDDDADSDEVQANWWLGNLLGLVARVDPASDFAKESKALAMMGTIEWRLEAALRDRDEYVQEIKDAMEDDDADEAARELCRVLEWRSNELMERTAAARVLGNFKSHLVNCIDARNWDGVTGLCKDGLATSTSCLATTDSDDRYNKKAARAIMEMCGQFLGVKVDEWTAYCGPQYSDSRHGFVI